MNSSVRNNILAGAFLIITILLAVWLTFTLSDRGVPGAKTPIVIRFDLSTGAHGIKEGSPILLGGQRVGQVSRIDYNNETTAATADAPAVTRQYVDVLGFVQDKLQLTSEAVAELDRPIVGSISTINISALARTDSASLPKLSKSDLSPDALVIKGELAPPAFLKQAGFGVEQANAVQHTVNDIEQSSNLLKTTLEENRPKFNEIVTSAQSIINRIDSKMPDWTQRIDTITADVSKSTAEFPEIAARLRKQVDEIDAFIARNKDKADSIVAKADSSMTSIDQATAKINTESIQSFNNTLREAQDALAKVQGPLKQVGDFINEDLPQLKTTLANARLTSEQLKLTANEVRAQPWRLLVRPDTRELSMQLLFDAARSYAAAISDLKATADSLSAAQNSSTKSDERINLLAKDLEDALKRARTAEETFLKRMSEK